MYIWELPAWQSADHPAFVWRSDALTAKLSELAEQQTLLSDQHQSLSNSNHTTGLQDELTAAHIDAVVASALRSSEIEGEHLDVSSLRSSVVTQLGLDKGGFHTHKKNGTQQTDALVQLLLSATTEIDQAISTELLCEWQSALFPDAAAHEKIRIGALRGMDKMQVVSGRIDRPTVHFEAPPGEGLDKELARFNQWFNHTPNDLDPFIRAGIAHLWFITLHPFDDGNGRVARALTDRALAQAEGVSARYYSLSAAIMRRRKEYYDILEHTQSSSLDITPWLSWFLDVLIDAMQQGEHRFDRVIRKARFWQLHAQTLLNERQIKVLNRLLDSWGEEFLDGINAAKYGSVGQVSKATSTRELADLVAKACLVKLPGGGRSTRYALSTETHGQS